VPIINNLRVNISAKPFVVGFDIANIAGQGESDSFIALRTWNYTKSLS
jgi:hypothetical protein